MVLHGPASYPAALFDPRGIYQLGDKVPAERSPESAIFSRVDGTFPHAKQQPDRGVSRPAGEEMASLDKGFMDELGAGDDNEGSLPHLHGENGTIFDTQVPNCIYERLTLEDNLKKVTYERPAWRPWWEVLSSTTRYRPVSPPQAKNKGSQEKYEEIHQLHFA